MSSRKRTALAQEQEQPVRIEPYPVVRADVYIAHVFTDMMGGQETRVFENLDDAKDWCVQRRIQIISLRAIDTFWNVTENGIHYLSGCRVGAAQIEPHNVVRASTESRRMSGLPREF